MKNLKMARKLGLGFGAVTLLTCLLGYVAYSALVTSSSSIVKISEAYMPASDATSRMVDTVRLASFAFRQYDFYGKQEDYDNVQKYLKTMSEVYTQMQSLSSRFPELTVLAATVREYPVLYSGYKTGTEATFKTMTTVNELLEIMLASAAKMETSLHDLTQELNNAHKVYHAQNDIEGMLRNGTNLYTVGEIGILFKEIRRLYANARPSFDISVRDKMDVASAQALKFMDELQSNLVLPLPKEKGRAASEALKAYLTALDKLLLGWGDLRKASQDRLDYSNRLIDLLERLNDACNENADKFAKAASTEASASTTLVAAVTGAVLVLSILLSLVITRVITGPLNRSMRFAQAVAAGNLNDELDVQSRDEVGKLADALRDMVKALKEKIGEANEQAAQARKMGEEAHQAMDEAKIAQKAAENAKREGMLLAAEQLESIVEVVSTASAQLSAQVAESEQGASITSDRMGETATAMEEMNATVLEVARGAGNAAQVSNTAKAKAEQGAVIVENVVKCITNVEQQSALLKKDMLQLGQQAEAIGAIMNVISDIADQTNLLALNAAIEAARAGEAGRGFAVVADEVRKLAEKTMQATVEVGNAIKGVQQSADKNMRGVDTSSEVIAQATELVHQAGVSLKEIVTLVEDSADQVRAIATAAEEQSSTSDEINRSLGTINSASSETARAMAEAAQAVSNLSMQTQRLTRLITEMKQG